MAEEEKIAVTAIRDMTQEGFIAASLKNSGWKVIYRATSMETLRERILDFPTALIIYSDDFVDTNIIEGGKSISLRGRSRSLGPESQLNPCTEFELQEIIRSHTNTSLGKSHHIPAATSRIFAISSIGRRVGVSTIALNIADLLSRADRSVLLVDGNRFHPTLAHHFQLHNIREKATETQYGFSIFEVADLDGLGRLASLANTFDDVVIDFGQLLPEYVAGMRVDDCLAAWVKSSQSHNLICSRNDAHSDLGTANHLRSAKTFGSHQELSLAYIPTKVYSRSEQRKIIDEKSKRFGVPVHFFSRDLRSIEKMENQNSTLALSAPKSPLIGDIARYLERGRYS